MVMNNGDCAGDNFGERLKKGSESHESSLVYLVPVVFAQVVEALHRLIECGAAW